MIEPTIDELLTKTENKYSLTVISAKRAREIVAGAPILSQKAGAKPVTTALCEIGEGCVSYRATTEMEDKIK